MGLSLANPEALLWLFPLLGVVIVLYLLRMRRRDIRVPAVFLWPKLTADVRANAPFQRLRFSWLLLVQLLIVALILLAFAGPLHRAHGLQGKATVIVLDASASMAATDIKPSRFDSARRRIEDVIATMGSDDRCALIEAGSVTRVIAPLTGDSGRLRNAIRGVRVDDSSNDMGEALRLASAIAGSRTGGRIIVYSDGSFPQVTDFSPGQSEVLFEPVGSSGSNVAITALDTATAPDGRKQLFAGIRNESLAPMTGTYSALADGQIVDAKSVTLQGGQTIGETETLPPGTQRAEAKIDFAGDMLKADDDACTYVQGAGTVRVLLVTPGDLFLERALALEPSLRVDKSDEVPATDRADADGAGDYDIVVFDGVPPVPVKAPATLCFGTPNADYAVADEGPDMHPTVGSWNRDDPVMRNVDLTNTIIERAHHLRLLPGGRALATGASGPLMVESERNGHRRIYVGFNLLESDLPLRVAFPIFIDNAIGWLTGAGIAHGGGITARAGVPFDVAVPGDTRTATLTAPDGTSTDLDASSGMVTVRDANLIGTYTLRSKDRKLPIAVNLLDEAESDIHPHNALDLPGHSVRASAPSPVLAEIWRPLALISLALLALEWWIFVKKS